MKGFFKMLLASFVGTSFALIIAVFLFMGIIGSMVALSSSSVVAEVKPNSLIKINLSSIVSDYQEQDPMGSLSSMDFQSLNNKPMQLIDAVKAINEAALDPAVKLIYINAAETVIPLSNLEELRCALQNFREISGKPVVAYMNNLYTLSSLLLSSPYLNLSTHPLSILYLSISIPIHLPHLLICYYSYTHSILSYKEDIVRSLRIELRI